MGYLQGALAGTTREDKGRCEELEWASNKKPERTLAFFL